MKINLFWIIIKHMKRVFLAINFSEKVKDVLADCQKRLRADFDYDCIKWVDRENLHVTLAFIPAVREDKIDLLKKELKQVEFNPFDYNLGEVKHIPDRRRAKLIWADIESEPMKLLKKEIDKVLSLGLACNYSPDEREFSPHVTLGRVKSFQYKKIPLEEIPLIEEFLDLSLTAESFELMESKLKRSGPNYEIIKSYF